MYPFNVNGNPGLNVPGYGYPHTWNAPGYGYPGVWGAPGGMPPQPGMGYGQNPYGPPAQKPGGIKGFFQGIAQGAVNTVKGIFTPQGILGLGAVAGLTYLTGGAILPLLGAIGLGIGGYQVLKGAANGDTHKMGEGVFSLGLSSLGFLLGGRTVGIKGADQSKVTYNLQSASGGPASFLDSVKSVFGIRKFAPQAPAGGGALPAEHRNPMNLYEVAWAKLKNSFSGISDRAAGSTGTTASGDSFVGRAHQADASGSAIAL